MPDVSPLVEAATVRWEPRRVPVVPPWPQPPLLRSLVWGARGRCPCCGRTALFAGFMRVAPACARCDAPLGDARADDAPPYFNIVLVAHVVIPLMLLAEQLWSPSSLLMAAVFVPMAGLLSVALLRPVKGACVALALRLGLLREDDGHGDALGAAPGMAHGMAPRTAARAWGRARGRAWLRSSPGTTPTPRPGRRTRARPRWPAWCWRARR